MLGNHHRGGRETFGPRPRWSSRERPRALLSTRCARARGNLRGGLRPAAAAPPARGQGVRSSVPLCLSPSLPPSRPSSAEEREDTAVNPALGAGSRSALGLGRPGQVLLASRCRHICRAGRVPVPRAAWSRGPRRECAQDTHPGSDRFSCQLLAAASAGTTPCPGGRDHWTRGNVTRALRCQPCFGPPPLAELRLAGLRAMSSVCCAADDLGHPLALWTQRPGLHPIAPLLPSNCLDHAGGVTLQPSGRLPFPRFGA